MVKSGTEIVAQSEQQQNRAPTTAEQSKRRIRAANVPSEEELIFKFGIAQIPRRRRPPGRVRGSARWTPLAAATSWARPRLRALDSLGGGALLGRGQREGEDGAPGERDGAPCRGAAEQVQAVGAEGFRVHAAGNLPRAAGILALGREAQAAAILIF
ncbi:unnamed protein product [Urochloa humidicola]